MDQYFKKYSTQYTAGVLIALFFLSLVPYLSKAFHIDDPLFLWTAKHIQADPIHFYNFMVNWDGTEMPMWTRNQNPPLVSYYIAAVSYLMGWSESALHFALLAPALAVVAGTYFLAKGLCSKPFLSTVSGLMTPVFLVSSTTIMSDVLMLSFWVWAVYLWMHGIKEQRVSKLLIASVLIAASSLSKYFGASLIPLLFCYSIVQTRRVGVWLFPLLIPVSILILYQVATKAFYGQGLLFNAVSYSVSYSEFQSSVLARFGTLLAFIGGCFISVVLFIPFLWRKRTLAFSLVLPVAMIVLLSQLGSIGSHQATSEEGIDWIFIITFTLFAYAGILIIAIIVADLIKNMNSDSWLIFLWSIGTLAFTGFLNWSINGRSILPLSPLFGIVLVRCFDHRKLNIELHGSWKILGVLVLAVVIGHLIALADYKFANTARRAAHMITAAHRGNPATLWFQGHWGFQYYMESLGGKAIDSLSPSFVRGDIIVVPSNNTGGVIPIAPDMIEKISEVRLPTNSYVTTMNSRQGAGFYSDVFGPLPYAIGSELIVTYSIYMVL